MVRALKSGQTVRNTLEVGSMIKQMVTGNYIMQTAIFTKANGLKTKQMGKVFILMLMEQVTQEIGEMISNTVSV